jgi:hypothetical protein
MFERIRRNQRDEGLSIRALAERHEVHRRTVRQALANATPSKRSASSMRIRLSSARTALFAVFHDTARACAIRATVRCPTTSPSSAQRSALRDSFARGFGGQAHVLPPDVPTADARVATDLDQQSRRPPGQRLVSQLPGHGVAGDALAAAAPAPRIGLDDPAGQHRPVGLQTLPADFETELVEAAERGQVRTSEGTVSHVEVFRMGGVGTPILGRPRPLPRDRRAALDYTLICEEPVPSVHARRSLVWREEAGTSIDDGSRLPSLRTRLPAEPVPPPT